MKKTFIVLCTIVFVFSIVGCAPFARIKSSYQYDNGIMQVTVDTKGQKIDSKENYKDIQLGFYETPDADNLLGDSSDLVKATAKARGNITKNYPKKPYTLKLDSKNKTAANVLFDELTVGSGDGSTTIKKLTLLANYLDPSMLKNDLALSMSGNKIAAGNPMFQMEWTVNHRFVDLNWNGQYNGQYLLTDHTQNIAKYLKFKKSQPDGNIGFMVEMDTYFDEDPKFRTAEYDMPCMVKYPDWDDVKYTNIDSDDIDHKVPEAVAAAKEEYKNVIVPEFVQKIINDKEAILKNGSWSEIDAAFDIDSFISFWLINSIMENHDAFFPKSVYLYQKKTTDKLHAGPVWDFDYSTLMNNDTNIFQTWYYATFFEKDEFNARLKNAWAQLRTDGYISNTKAPTVMPTDGYKFADYLHEYINTKAVEIRKSWDMNAAVWDINTIWKTEQFQTFDGFVYSLHEALDKRVVQLDAFINAL